MLKTDALLYFGSKTKLAQAAGIRLASLYSWKGDLVPEGRAMRLFGRLNVWCNGIEMKGLLVWFPTDVESVLIIPFLLNSEQQ
ncbi:DNA-binding transcriptional regulator DicC [Escherichia coli ECC-Z]|nr:DNA-binding transcriptional regulator DicC [Escherichia coli ECC-Z]